MKFLSTTIILFGALASLGRATISIGDNGNGENIAWIEGEDVCGGRLANINPSGENPCEINFTLDNGYSYHLGGCGTTGFSLYNSDGSLNHPCQFVGKKIHCKNLNRDFHKNYIC